jgi:hypothetical protein
MGLLSWFIIGLIVGIIAKIIMPGKDPVDLSLRLSWELPVPLWGDLPALESASALSAVLICTAY